MSYVPGSIFGALPGLDRCLPGASPTEQHVVAPFTILLMAIGNERLRDVMANQAGNDCGGWEYPRYGRARRTSLSFPPLSFPFLSFPFLSFPSLSFVICCYERGYDLFPSP